MKKISIFTVIAFALLFSVINSDILNAKELSKVIATEGLPPYKATINDQIPGIKISIICVINNPVDKETLEKLGNDAYKQFNCDRYKRTFIEWLLPHYQKGNGAWGITHFEGNKMKDVSILALQG